MLGLCEAYGLYTALAAVYNQIHEYRRPVAVMLAALAGIPRTGNSFSQGSNGSGALPLPAPGAAAVVPASLLQVAYKLLAYLRCGFRGWTFPPAPAAPADADAAGCGRPGRGARRTRTGSSVAVVGSRHRRGLGGAASSVDGGVDQGLEYEDEEDAELAAALAVSAAEAAAAAGTAGPFPSAAGITGVGSGGAGATSAAEEGSSAAAALLGPAPTQGEVRAQLLGTLLFSEATDLAREWRVGPAEAEARLGRGPYPALRLLLGADAAAAGEAGSCGSEVAAVGWGCVRLEDGAAVG